MAQVYYCTFNIIDEKPFISTRISSVRLQEKKRSALKGDIVGYVKVVFLLSGPDRAIEETLCSVLNLENLEAFAIIVHVWKTKELSEKRANQIRNLPGVSHLEISKDLEARGFGAQLGNLKSSTHSPGLHSAQMFWGVHESIQIATTLFPESTHIVRMRTDLALKPRLGETFNTGKLVVSKSANLPLSWSSDHLMAGPKDLMSLIWQQNSVEDLISEFVSAKSHPEFMLSLRLRRLSKEIRRIKVWRFLDYEIIRRGVGDVPPKSLNLQFRIFKRVKERTFAVVLIKISSLIRSAVHEIAYRVGRIP